MHTWNTKRSSQKKKSIKQLLVIRVDDLLAIVFWKYYIKLIFDSIKSGKRFLFFGTIHQWYTKIYKKKCCPCEHMWKDQQSWTLISCCLQWRIWRAKNFPILHRIEQQIPFPKNRTIWLMKPKKMDFKEIKNIWIIKWFYWNDKKWDK